ncbi:family 43 glycosylhydrolase [Mucilaginibacter boryungensis]|uniref:Family 43 glycosylhydrolase n=1 Tax=Mucilaginibacter boryungensis TaxID=768480 RepID=A0ABR9XEN2_9SPHI|nr:family 43 glycosylhydrolase [Mucilaginibacter boryungensis]MBE9665518.1 family 43 glycosylhydrolase [Mucilaginibacter boryungensis]
MKRKAFCNALYCLVLLMVGIGRGFAQQSDNQNGTYTNPVIWADFPDNDVIRVDDTYYMVTTTMFYLPGVPVMRSKDLVNWEYAANAVQRFDMHPAYNMEGGNRYGHGQWATSMRYRNGKFYLLFKTNDEGGFLSTATRAEGPWTTRKLPRGFHDPGLFFDDDGKIYVVHGYSTLSLTQLDENFAPIGKDSLIYSKVARPGLEGSHVYKINGLYYIYATYGGADGYQVCLRSKSIYGPYEEKVVLKDDMNLTGMGVHQGALVETQIGQWWSVIFQDRVGVGRVPTLQPVTWTDGWPMVGINGRAVVTYKKPDVGKTWPVKTLPTSDEFNDKTLGLQWSWNHNPDERSWSLAEHKGFLRLTTAKITDSLPMARNTLTQRIFGPSSTAVAAFALSGMKDGDMCGLAVFQKPYASIAARRTDKGFKIIMINNGKQIDSVDIDKRDKIFLRATAVTTKDLATFSYSFNNRDFKPLGNQLTMAFSLKIFTGNRFALFNYATKQIGGFVDIDWFRMRTRQGPPDLFRADAIIEAEMYDEIHLAKTGWCHDTVTGKDQCITKIVNGSRLVYNQIDFGKGQRFMHFRVASNRQLSPGRIEVYLDGNLNTPLTAVSVATTGNWQHYQTLTAPIQPLIGRHQLTLKFIGGEGELMNLNWFTFSAGPKI